MRGFLAKAITPAADDADACFIKIRHDLSNIYGVENKN